MYAGDIVILHSNKDINIGSDFFNDSLVVLNNKLNFLHSFNFPQKCKMVIFTRKQRFITPNFKIEGA